MFIKNISFTSEDLAELEGWENRYYSVKELIDSSPHLKNLSTKLRADPEYDTWVASAKESLKDLINTSDMVQLTAVGVFQSIIGL